MVNSRPNPGGIPIVYFIFEWILPPIGSVLTVTLIWLLGLDTVWAILLAPLGALLFPWSVALVLVALALFHEALFHETG